MRKSPHSIDGFVPKPGRHSIGDVHRSSLARLGESNRPRIGQNSQPLRDSSQLPAPKHVSRSEVDESLRGIDDEEPKKPRHRLFGRRRNKPVLTRRKKISRRIIKFIVIILLIIVAFVGIRAFIAGSSIFKGNIFDIFQSKPLKMDNNGRTNILVLGTTDDDPSHPGNNLTDTIIVLSIDQYKKNAYLFSIPRDLWVEYGKACDAGYQGKINVYFSCANSGTSDTAEQDRLTKAQAFVGGIIGLDIQYGVHVNSVVVRDSVNAVGGIDVNIQGSGGAPGILDRNFDGQCNYTCYNVKYSNGVHHLNGGQAMYLSMARGEQAPTYGLGRSNFDREVNQQKVIVALKTKAVSAGTLANPAMVTALLDSVGKNLRTNFQTSEIQTLIGLAKDIPDSKINRLSLVDSGNELVQGGNIGGASMVQPVAGLFNYSAIQAFVQKQLNANEVTRESAHVALFNASGIEGYAATQATELEKKGFTITATNNAPDGKYGSIDIYDVTNKKPATKKKLESVYNTTVKSGPSPLSVSTDTDFVVIFGQKATAN